MKNFFLILIFSTIFSAPSFALEPDEAEFDKTIDEIYDVKPIDQEPLINKDGLEYFDDGVSEGLDAEIEMDDDLDIEEDEFIDEEDEDDDEDDFDLGEDDDDGVEFIDEDSIEEIE